MKSQQIKEPAVDKESALKKYFDEIKDTKPLTKEEEAELAQRIHNGDEKAKEELITANLKFVVSVAKNYQHRGLDLEDLINDGNVGLIKAAERFDGTKGYRFISYAVWWIRESILEALAKNGRTIRLPRNQIELIGKINTTIKEFELEHGRIPTAEEISKILEVVDKKVQFALESSSRVESIDSAQTVDDDRTILDKYDAPDTVAADKELIDEETSAEFKRRHLSFADMVENLFQAMLNRSAEAAEKTDLVNMLKNGQRLKSVLNAISSSDEYISLCKNCGLTPGIVKVPVIIKK